ncbi:MAG: hypothetical protein ACKVRP_10105 [Bacteroidota bacterium]
MGSQQLLLIIVAVVLIGISVAIGVWMFIDQGAATNRDSISNDLVQYAAQAQKYYRRPQTLGGGNNSFGGLTLSKVTSKSTNANGAYTLSPDPAPATATSVQIIGLGRELGSDGETPLQMTMTVWSDSILIVADN